MCGKAGHSKFLTYVCVCVCGGSKMFIGKYDDVMIGQPLRYFFWMIGGF